MIRLITEDVHGDLPAKSEKDLEFLLDYVYGFDFLKEYVETQKKKKNDPGQDKNQAAKKPDAIAKD